MLKELTRKARDLVAAKLRHLPVSSRVAGPPKGSYESFEEYSRATRDPLAKEWPVLAAESQTLVPPATLASDELGMFQPVDYRSPGFSVFRISHGRFHRDARALLTCDDRILTPFSAVMGSGSDDNWLFRKLALGTLTRVRGKALLLVGNRNYYHFLIEELPRVWLVRQAGFDLGAFDHILMFSPLHESQRTLCTRIGIDPKRIVPLENVPHVESKELFFATPPWHYGATYLKMARALNLGLSSPSSIAPMKRIYVSRERCTHGKITNGDELIAELTRLDFEKVTPEMLSFDDQVALFGQAEVIIGAHGAGPDRSDFLEAGMQGRGDSQS